MPVNLNKPERWKTDIAASVDLYNDWFMKFAPKAYRDQRVLATRQVQEALERSANLTNVTPKELRENPAMLEMLRMTTAPPIARDRLIGLAKVSQNLVKAIEIEKRIPPFMGKTVVESELQSICQLIMKLADRDIFSWLETGETPTGEEIARASTIVADRLCGAQSDPIIRNAQEKRQLGLIKEWLEQRGYSFVRSVGNFKEMKPGTFGFRVNILAKLEQKKPLKIPVDSAIMPQKAKPGELPLLIEAKSAGDFTNTNKRRKEELAKISQLRDAYGNQIRYILFLCGYFNPGYLGYEATEGIDWVWEHRIGDLADFGV